MQGFVDFVQGFLDLGATVILPVAIFFLGLFLDKRLERHLDPLLH